MPFAMPLLTKSLNDESRIVRGEAENTLYDFEVFLSGFTWEKYGLKRPEIPPELLFDDDDDEEEDDN